MSNVIQQIQKGSQFEIIVRGRVKEDWSHWLGNFFIEPLDNIGKGQTTKISGAITDQAALRGLMNQIWDLNLVIISFQQIDTLLDKKEGEKI